MELLGLQLAPRRPLSGWKAPSPTYSNKSWCIVGQGMFALWEINQMECEMCSYLEWQLNVDLSTLCESCVHHNFAGPGPSHCHAATNCTCSIYTLHEPQFKHSFFHNSCLSSKGHPHHSQPMCPQLNCVVISFPTFSLPQCPPSACATFYHSNP
jgi:hypothetical protein